MTLSPQNLPCCLSFGIHEILHNKQVRIFGSQTVNRTVRCLCGYYEAWQRTTPWMSGNLFHIHVSEFLKRYSLISCNSNKNVNNVLKPKHLQLPLDNYSNDLWLQYLNMFKSLMSLSDLYKWAPVCWEAFCLLCGYLCD